MARGRDKGSKEVNGMLDNINPDEDFIFFGIDVLDEKQFTMFIKKCEFLCRKSQEYDVWQRRTKALSVMQNPDPDKDDSEKCPICGIDYQFAPCESHHHPVTLFNLCVKQFQDWVDNMEYADKRPLDLIQEVMEKHLCNEVEHVVLCKHCHEKYHNKEQVTAEMLQKIIDYKRSITRDNAPTSIKEILDAKRERNKEYIQKKKEFANETLSGLSKNETKESLIKDLIDLTNLKD